MERIYKAYYTKEQWLKEMDRFYTLDEQKEWGVVAITFKKIN